MFAYGGNKLQPVNLQAFMEWAELSFADDDKSRKHSGNIQLYE